jgi:hypothetical protein
MPRMTSRACSGVTPGARRATGASELLPRPARFAGRKVGVHSCRRTGSGTSARHASTRQCSPLSSMSRPTIADRRRSGCQERIAKHDDALVRALLCIAAAAERDGLIEHVQNPGVTV